MVRLKQASHNITLMLTRVAVEASAASLTLM